MRPKPLNPRLFTRNTRREESFLRSDGSGNQGKPGCGEVGSTGKPGPREWEGGSLATTGAEEQWGKEASQHFHRPRALLPTSPQSPNPKPQAPAQGQAAQGQAFSPLRNPGSSHPDLVTQVRSQVSSEGVTPSHISSPSVHPPNLFQHLNKIPR